MTQPTQVMFQGQWTQKKSRYSSPVDDRSLDNLWPRITRWPICGHRSLDDLCTSIYTMLQKLCALYVRYTLSVLQKECRKVWGTRYRPENTVVRFWCVPFMLRPSEGRADQAFFQTCLLCRLPEQLGPSHSCTQFTVLWGFPGTVFQCERRSLRKVILRHVPSHRVTSPEQRTPCSVSRGAEMLAYSSAWQMAVYLTNERLCSRTSTTWSGGSGSCPVV
jgi:hypothetical protein